MPNYTENFLLGKPLPAEYYDVGVPNANMDILDTVVLGYGVATGTNAYALTLSKYTLPVGRVIRVKFTNANTTTSVTLNINATGALSVRLLGGGALAVGAIKAGGIYDLVYTGTQFQINGITAEYIPLTQKGATNGVPNLASDGKIPMSQLHTAENGGLATLGAGVMVPVAQLPRGIAGGVASLDSNTKIPVGQIPSLSSSYAVVSHASTAATYGLGSMTAYGHLRVATGNGLNVSDGAISLSAATLAQPGTVQLSNNLLGTSEARAATESAVGSLYQLVEQFAAGTVPVNHASTATTYGVASSTKYGHAMASSATPLIAGTANVGADNGKYAREGHVHPTDTSRAPTSHASAATTYGRATASVYGHAMASSATPLIAGTANAGTDNGKYAREGHVHPIQTTVSGNAGTATKLATARSLSLTGQATGSVSFDGSANAAISVTVTRGGTGAATVNTGSNNSAWGYYALANVSGSSNTAVGAYALRGNAAGVSGSYNTAIGYGAMYGSNADISGAYNTAMGYAALYTNTTGAANVAAGAQALRRNTTGYQNAAVGADTLTYNTTGFNNVAVGHAALYANTTGNSNTAVGPLTLNKNVTGLYNTAVGSSALGSNTTAAANTAVGVNALCKATTGGNNTALGVDTLQSNTTGYMNTALGVSALFSNTTGYESVAVGASALMYNTTAINLGVGTSALGRLTSGEGNAAVGNWAGYYYGAANSNLTTANYSVFLGTDARPNGNGQTNQIVIGSGARGGGSNSITLGDSSITKLSCQVTAISALSDRRIKEGIEPANLAMCLAAVVRLPIHRYKYKDFTGKHLDAHVTGFLADDVETVFPKAVQTSDQYFPVLGKDGAPVMETVTEPMPNGDVRTRQIEKMFKMEAVKDITMTEALPTLWGAVQRLAAIVEEQAAEIAKLKGGLIA